MDGIFLEVLNRSITVSWLILAVVVLRYLLRKAPRWIPCILWAFVALRLVCPVFVTSPISLMSGTEPIPQTILYADVSELKEVLSLPIADALAANPGASVNPVQIWVFAGGILWAMGVAAMVLYAIIGYLRIRKKVCASEPVMENIFISDAVSTPFLLGVVKPRIYLPSSMEEERRQYVVAHEQAHIRRRDYWWKPLGFLILAVYWFQPLCWLSYILFCRDMELACDEAVIGKLNITERKAYSEALLSCSIPYNMHPGIRGKADTAAVSACPLAFGEIGVKERIKAVLHYKKPMFWLVSIAILLCVVVGICFLTNPEKAGGEWERQRAEKLMEKLFSDLFFNADVYLEELEERGEKSQDSLRQIQEGKVDADSLVLMQEMYGEYFTESGWVEAIFSRIPTLGVNLFTDRYEEPSKMIVNVKEQGTDGWYICEVELQYEDGSDSYLFTMQVVSEDGERKINAVKRNTPSLPKYIPDTESAGEKERAGVIPALAILFP